MCDFFVLDPPQPLPNPIDKFGFAIGKLGVISLEIQANPAPHLEWTVRDEKIVEGSTDRSGRIEAATVKDLVGEWAWLFRKTSKFLFFFQGNGIYEATLRIASITKQDTETQFRLSAYNTMGKQDYYVQISTEPEPEGNLFVQFRFCISQDHVLFVHNTWLLSHMFHAFPKKRITKVL